MAISNEKFIKFIKSYSKNQKYYEVVAEISRSKTFPFDSLVESYFKMYSLDDICKDSKSFGKYNTPKTTDALWYKEENGKLTLYIIEFKFHNFYNNMTKTKIQLLYEQVKEINEMFKTTKDDGETKYLFNENFFKDFRKLKSSFGDNIEFSLKMKPIETLIYALPELYKEYCGYDDELDAEECRKFLKKIDKKLVVFLMQGSVYKEQDKNKNYYNGRGKYDKSRTRATVKGTSLHKQFIRFKHAKIIDDYEIKSRFDFDKFLNQEHLN